MIDFKKLAKKHGTPLFIYDLPLMKKTAQELNNMQLPFGLTVRYAVKANAHPQIISLFDELGLHFDASSTYEAKMLINQGISGSKISLSAQTLDGPLQEVLDEGILPVATSMYQIDLLAKLKVSSLAVRFNPGIGSGHSNRTNVGGPSSSFGIWHEYIDEVLAKSKKQGIRINRLHTHIGSGADPAVWRKVMIMSLGIAEKLPDVETIDIGGGYKISRMPSEQATDMSEVLAVFGEELTNFAKRTGRKLKLEIEPGTYLVANAGSLIAEVQDIVDTGRKGHTFLRLNTGMNDILRPSMYGAQHPIQVLNESKQKTKYILVGHNCESGDILTPAQNNPEEISERALGEAAIGDLVIIGGAGAYCYSMSAKDYNSFPSANEICV